MRDFVDNAVVVTDGDIIFYYTGFYVDDGFLIVKNDKRYLITDGRYIESARKFANAECYLGSEVSLEDMLSRLQVSSVGLIYGYTSALIYEKIVSLGYCVYDCTLSYNELSAIKTLSQLNSIKRACSICEQAFVKTLPFIKEGVSELEISGELEHNFKKLGANVGFETIVAFSKNSAVPHHKSNGTKLEKDMPILIDMGAKYQGYSSDITRTVFFGNPSMDVTPFF